MYYVYITSIVNSTAAGVLVVVYYKYHTHPGGRLEMVVLGNPSSAVEEIGGQYNRK